MADATEVDAIYEELRLDLDAINEKLASSATATISIHDGFHYLALVVDDAPVEVYPLSADLLVVEQMIRMFLSRMAIGQKSL
jgi:hypothetical protein